MSSMEILKYDLKFFDDIKENSSFVITDNTIKLMQLVSKYPNQGHGGKILKQFLKTFDKEHIWLKVAVNNKGAIRVMQEVQSIYV